MGSPYFRFKQFTVWHDRCAMKVGTDGVLLGAWAGPGRPGGMSGGSPQTILDIGTGSGLVALMLAQRFPEAQVTGIDSDAEAAAQARENFAVSPWPQRLRAAHISLQEFCRGTAATAAARRFDLVVSNPPFYDTTLTSPDPLRTAARHTGSLRHGGLQSDRSLRVREIHPAAGGQKQTPSAPAHPRLFQTVLPAPAYPGHLRQTANSAAIGRFPYADRYRRHTQPGAHPAHTRFLP